MCLPMFSTPLPSMKILRCLRRGRALAHTITLIALFACALIIGATYISLPDQWWQGRTFWLLLGIVLIAFALRILFLRDLVLNSPQYQVLPSGSDHRSYVAGAADILRGHWPPAGQFLSTTRYHVAARNSSSRLGHGIFCFAIRSGVLEQSVCAVLLRYRQENIRQLSRLDRCNTLGFPPHFRFFMMPNPSRTLSKLCLRYSSSGCGKSLLFQFRHTEAMPTLVLILRP